MNDNYKERDRILFGEYDPDKYLGGIRRFQNIDVQTLNTLVAHNYIELSECQNDSPSTEEFLEYAKAHPDIRFCGYAVSPDRDDYRITIEEVYQTLDGIDEILEFVRYFRFADEFTIDECANGLYEADAWWD